MLRKSRRLNVRVVVEILENKLLRDIFPYVRNSERRKNLTRYSKTVVALELYFRMEKSALREKEYAQLGKNPEMV